jgi:hypothetical protein
VPKEYQVTTHRLCSYTGASDQHLLNLQLVLQYRQPTVPLPQSTLAYLDPCHTIFTCAVLRPSIVPGVQGIAVQSTPISLVTANETTRRELVLAFWRIASLKSDLHQTPEHTHTSTFSASIDSAATKRPQKFMHTPYEAGHYESPGDTRYKQLFECFGLDSLHMLLSLHISYVPSRSIPSSKKGQPTCITSWGVGAQHARL